MTRRFLWWLMMILPVVSGAAQPRPKIGLVLSGGGAKGFAHIRVLQVLDSLGIVPDYIAGTSMGSIVGGLYAAGYTGNQIDSIAKRLDWNQLLTNSVSFDEINIEEKDEFGRYIYELPLVGLKPKLPLGLIEGQQIEELLADLFFHVNTIHDFKKLPTPFLCVASDIIRGEPVVLRHGSLPTAIRASMSIPSIFAPVRRDGRLLVDGGVFNNLPVSYCRQMGATYIIASDVDGGLYRESELTSAAQLLMQTALLVGNITYRQEVKDVDLLIDIYPHLRYGTMDFSQRSDMMRAGNEAVREVIPRLVDLAKRQRTFPPRQVQPIPRVNRRYSIQNLTTDGISEPNVKLVQARFHAQPGEQLGSAAISARVHSLMGMRLFDKIGYHIEGDSLQSTLTLKATERPANAVKFAMHYDTERGAGVILNFTKRNFLLPASRFVTTVDLAESPRLRANYFYYLGRQAQWWHRTELYGERLLVNSFIQGTPVPDIVSQHTMATTMIHYSVSPAQQVGAGLIWQQNELRPKVDPNSKNRPDPLEIVDYTMATFGTRLFFQHNTLNKVFFPTRGKWLQVEWKVLASNRFRADLLQSAQLPSSRLLVEGLMPAYSRLNINAQHLLPLGSRSVVQLTAQIGQTFEMFAESGDFSVYDVAAGDFFHVGGQVQRPRPNSFLFMGLREGELSVPQAIVMGAHLQYTCAKNTYLIPTVNVLAGGYRPADFWRTVGHVQFSDQVNDHAFYQLGYGVTAAYYSILGPIQVSVAHNPQTGKVRGFFNIGFSF